MDLNKNKISKNLRSGQCPKIPEWLKEPMLRFKKIFSPKNLTTILASSAQNTASFCKKWITTLVHKKNAISLAENWE
jgi:Zn-dependent M32 family carboxypeptidase